MSYLRFSQTFLDAATVAPGQIFGGLTAEVDLVITELQINIQTAPTGDDITVELTDGDGVGLGAIATLDADADNQLTVLIEPLDVASGSIIRAKINTVGSTLPGEFLTLTLVGRYSPDSSEEMFPEEVATCTLYGYQYLNGLPSEDTRVAVRLNNVPVVSSTTVFEDGPQHVDTDELGFWSIDVVQGQNYLLTIWKAGILNESIVIPFAPACNVASLI